VVVGGGAVPTAAVPAIIYEPNYRQENPHLKFDWGPLVRVKHGKKDKTKKQKGEESTNQKSSSWII
jgi:hypothetical protein